MSLNSKIILIGEARVGKTSIRKRYMGQGYSTNYHVTLGADFSSKSIEILTKDSKKENVRFTIWDIAGQVTYDAIRRRFLASTSGIILVCDLSKIDTFHMLTSWLGEVWKINKTRSIPILLIGNKTDLLEEREVYTSLLRQYAREVKDKFPEIPFFEVIETSALTGANIDLVFEMMAEALLDTAIVDSTIATIPC